MRNIKVYFLILVMSIFCVCIYSDLAIPKEPEEPTPLTKEDVYNQLELFADTITIINANYVDEVDPKNLIYGALKGMLRSLDLHSDFLTPEKFEEIKIDTGGEFGGLGIEITIRDNLLTIVTPLEDTPAYKVGLMPDDKIIKINDESTKDFSLDDAVKRMRGKPGTEVTLTIMREGEERLRDYTIKRALIKIAAVKDALILEDGIGYVRITDFQQKTPKDLEKALRKLEKEKFSALILDLRNNPGGLLDASIGVSEKFLPKDTVIVSIKGRVEAQEKIFKSKNKRPRLDFPMVILANKGSASASEIVAAAIKDNKRGIILGTPTFGKGSVQTVIPLRDGSALRLTTSKYYTPAGELIHKSGVAPDVLIKRVAPVVEKEKPEDIFKKLEHEEISRADELKKDNQIKSAIELLKGINVYKAFGKK